MKLYEQTCEVFVKNQVEFIVIGGFAVNYWGYNRSTGDMDFFVNPDTNNINRLFKALDELGFVIDGDAKKAIQNGELIQFSAGHQVIELLFRINLQKAFIELLGNASHSKFGETEIPFISLEELIDEKVKSRREKDLQDVYELKKINNID